MKRVRVTEEDLGYAPTEVNGVFKDLHAGKFLKKVDGEWFECFSSGYIRDGETDTHVASYGKIFKKPQNSREDEDHLALRVARYMLQCFPETYPYTHRGLVPVYECSGSHRNLLSVEEVAKRFAEKQAAYGKKAKKKEGRDEADSSR